MVSRLVLGSGSLGQALVRALSEKHGELLVISEDEMQVRTLREEGVAAEQATITDAGTLQSHIESPDTVVVADDRTRVNEAVTRAAREAYPDALLVAYAGIEPDESATTTLDQHADRVVDPGSTTTEYLFDRIGEAGIRTRKLMDVLRSIDDTLAIVTHDNPDPDAIAGAIALARIGRLAGLEVDVCYFGEITHQENMAFVNLLDVEMTNLSVDDPLPYDGFALVDHSRPGVNDQLPKDLAVDVVIDHHPPRAPVEARFVDLRSDVGATSTLLVDYLRQLDLPLDETVATALLFGIRVDTDEFSREVCAEDFEASAYLLPHADFGTLERVESPSMSPDTLETIARAITNRKQHGLVATSCVGSLSKRDALAQAADRLLDIEDVSSTFVYGVMDDAVYVSARARGTDVDLGETLRDAFGQIGSAGGHADMAGAQIPLGMLDAETDDDVAMLDVVESVVGERFLDAVEDRTHRVITNVYPDEFMGLEALADATVFVSQDAEQGGQSPVDDDDAPTTADDEDAQTATDESPTVDGADGGDAG
jgi:nanoRNase/pAp phosphatase (c-di-AMP/oligoRNAs hydrolase)